MQGLSATLRSSVHICVKVVCFPAVSVLAVEEYEDLQNSLEMEKDLRERAETLAREVRHKAGVPAAPFESHIFFICGLDCPSTTMSVKMKECLVKSK